VSYYNAYFDRLASHLNDVDTADLDQVAELLVETQRRARKVIVVGNGGSAAISSHLSLDLVKAAGIRAINFNEASLLTCFGNDYGYEHWVAKAIGFYGDPGDLAILISSSGQSQNMINGALAAKAQGLRIVTFSGFRAENPLRGLGDINIWADSQSYNLVEMTHQVWLLSIIDKLIDEKGAGR